MWTGCCLSLQEDSQENRGYKNTQPSWSILKAIGFKFLVLCFDTILDLVLVVPVDHNNGTVEEVSFDYMSHFLRPAPERCLPSTKPSSNTDPVFLIQAINLYVNDVQGTRNSKQMKSKKSEPEVPKNQSLSVYENVELNTGQSDIIYENIWSKNQDTRFRSEYKCKIT